MLAGKNSSGLAAAVAVAALELTACTTAPHNAAEEQLDERSGTTVTRLQQPLTLLADRPRGQGADPFAFLAPFETNRMGTRHMYLWVAVPVESGAAASIAVTDGDVELLASGTALDVATLGLAATPYRTSAAWQQAFIGDMNATTLDRLTTAANLTIELRHADGHSERFVTQQSPGELFAEFRRRVGL